MVAKPQSGVYDAIVLAVAHREFAALGAKGVRAFGSPNVVIFDVKNVLPKDASDARL
jgi:UDP-N-acetyl-D-galactosamine dehydrogenase